MQEEYHVEVDWQNNIDQIEQNYTLTEKQTLEGLVLIANAQKLYDNLGDETPQNIILFGSDCSVIHKIITRKGKPCTVEVRYPKFFTRNMVLAITAGLTITGLVTGLYLNHKRISNVLKYR